MVFKCSLLDAQRHKHSVEKKSVSLIVVSSGKAIIRTHQFLRGRQVLPRRGLWWTIINKADGKRMKPRPTHMSSFLKRLIVISDRQGYRDTETIHYYVHM